MFKKFAGRFCCLAAILYLVAFFCWSSQKLLACQRPVGGVLQLIFIGVLIFWRCCRKSPLYFVADPVLVCLPYFWSLANAGSAVGWFDVWKLLLLSVFALSMLNLPLQKAAFKGGLRSNVLLQSSLCSIFFVVAFVSAMSRFFASFPDGLYRATMLNLLVLAAGVPVSIAAFYELVPGDNAADS